MHLARAGQPMLFLGEKSTGRSLLARVANQAAGKLPIVDLYPEYEETFPIEAAKLLSTDGDVAVIVHNLSILKPEQVQLIEKLCLNRRGKLSLYITAAREFQGSGLDLPENLKRAVEFTVLVPPLREREADVFHLALSFIRKNRNIYPEIPLRAIQVKYLQDSLRKAQHVQIADIGQHVLRLCLGASPPVLAEPTHKNPAANQIAAETLSPLEDSERTVIRTFLLKNKLNKRRTAFELDITINTLVAKISRYKLNYLFER
jgi:transcriptional regulator with AAA-type ATPase domain